MQELQGGVPYISFDAGMISGLTMSFLLVFVYPKGLKQLMLVGS